MKKILLVLFFLFISAASFANNFGLESTTDRIRIMPTSEAANYYSYSWEVYDISNNVKLSGSGSIYVPGYVTDISAFIAANADFPTVRVIVNDEEKDNFGATMDKNSQLKNQNLVMENSIIDISHFQTISDIKKVKDAGIVAIIHKATQGATYRDPEFKDNQVLCAKNDIMFGAYHFGTGTNVSIQAKNFLNTVKPDETTLCVLDYETNTTGSQMSLAQAKEFIRIIQEETGRYPVLYSGNVIKADLRNNVDEFLQNCPLWVCHYKVLKPKIPANWKYWTMWQYTETGYVEGIGRCDRNMFNGSAAGLRRLWGYTDTAELVEGEDYNVDLPALDDIDDTNIA